MKTYDFHQQFHRRIIANRVIWILLFATFVAIAFTAGRRAHDADSVLTAFMSLQKLTWYYWEQNRFGNLIPFLALPVRDPQANFYFQIFLRDLSSALAPLLPLLFIGERHLIIQRYVVALLLIVIAGHGVVDTIFGPAVPQAESCAIFAGGLWLAASGGFASFSIKWLLCVIIFWLAFFVNMSLVAIVLPIMVLNDYFASERRLPGAITWAAIIAGAGAFLHASFFYPKTTGSLNLDLDALNTAAKLVLGDVNLTILVTALLAAGLIAVKTTYLRRREMMAIQIPVRHATMLAVILGSSVLFANLLWVQQNGQSVRYYTVQTVFLFAVAASSLVSALNGVEIIYRHRIATYAVLAVVTAVSVAYRASPFGQIYFVSGSTSETVEKDTVQLVAVLSADQPAIFVGSYWLVVPMAFKRMALQHNTDTYPVNLEMAHSEPIVPAVTRILNDDKPFSIVCVALNVSRCREFLGDHYGLGSNKMLVERSADLQAGDTTILTPKTF